MASAIYNELSNAIRQKLTIVVDYNGYTRLLCPHAIGRKRGKEHLLAYQFGGDSSQPIGPDGSTQNWRCMDVAQLSNLSTRTGPWHTAPNHTRRQTCIDDIDVEVSY
ncbi:MAG TPA: hypothetical protein VMU41_13940 [Candidatus Binataceae bacterium]|nr:hypothetical protein [Candidatus Binataceae bacterium]